MFRNISNTFLSRFLASFIGLIVAIIISNYLGAEGRGEQGLILTTITLITIVSAIIGAGSITYLSPRLPMRKLILPSYLWSFIVVLILIVSIPFQNFFSISICIHIAILSLILSGTQIQTGILLGREKILQSNYIQLFSSVLFLISIVIFFVFFKTRSIQSYIYSLYISYIPPYLLSVFYVVKLPFQSLPISDISYFDSFKKIARYGLLNQLDVFVQMASFRISYYLIDYYIGKDEVGVYSNAVSIIESIWMISRSISMVQHARIVNSTDINYSKDLTVTLLKISSLLVFVACITLLIIPSGFYVFLFGDDFAGVKTIILTFLPGVLVFNASFVLSAFFAGIGKYEYNVIASSVGLIVTIVTLIILIPIMGVIGAGITASISYISVTLIKSLFLLNKYKVPIKEMALKKRDIELIRTFFSFKNFIRSR